MKVYVCDACGRIMTDPHQAAMKEFYLSSYIDVDGDPVARRFTKKVKIDLCPDCFHTLHLIRKKEYKKDERA